MIAYSLNRLPTPITDFQNIPADRQTDRQTDDAVSQILIKQMKLLPSSENKQIVDDCQKRLFSCIDLQHTRTKWG